MTAAVDLVTGAFSYSGAHIARRLLELGREVRTLTSHPDREHPLRTHVAAKRYRFDDPVALTRTLTGVDTLYNTYWVRFDRGRARQVDAVEHSRMLFAAARRAGVRRIVHVSITNPSINSPLAYFRGKALVEYALAQTPLSYAIVRPTLLFGGDRDVLINNIAWILRHLPVFAIPGDGAYPVQPVHVEDLARICTDAGQAEGDLLADAAGPQRMPFRQLVALVRGAIGARAPVVPVPPLVMAAAARGLGATLGDVVLTADEIAGLMDGLLVTDQPSRGEIAFGRWLEEHADTIGRTYANELDRHYPTAT